ncbi:hypothetical protein KGM_211297 [Danaus plexippus plexippus]|uniref:Uncharacterized protein n=1 Tax=Danaus plexippus plexippus TaxID=278856 RepID=A0A212FKR8_DANPL|nr:hypothetical protein KGM_211297 [Danaus plexippus plexippus]
MKHVKNLYPASSEARLFGNNRSKHNDIIAGGAGPGRMRGFDGQGRGRDSAARRRGYILNAQLTPRVHPQGITTRRKGAMRCANGKERVGIHRVNMCVPARREPVPVMQ